MVRGNGWDFTVAHKVYYWILNLKNLITIVFDRTEQIKVLKKEIKIDRNFYLLLYVV